MRGRAAEYPEMEHQLFLEFEEMRQAGKPVKRWSLVRRTKQILNEKNPDHKIRFSNDWFERFRKRYNISLGRKTHSLKSFTHTFLDCNLVAIIKMVILRTCSRHLCRSY